MSAEIIIDSIVVSNHAAISLRFPFGLNLVNPNSGALKRLKKKFAMHCRDISLSTVIILQNCDSVFLGSCEHHKFDTAYLT